MTTCDVLVVGGGPSGSTCAWALGRAGLDVIVIDRALFPRDKLCAGWITPQVLTSLDLDVDAYRRGRTFQPITGFRTGVIGRADAVDTAYGQPISFGILRSEFDHYLLQRSKARLVLGTAVTGVHWNGSRWTVNDSISAPMLVGAGGHFCSVARRINGTIAPVQDSSLVVAQELEFEMKAGEGRSCAVAGDRPELYFSQDLKGYGWCFRKGNYLNVGFGRADRRSLPKSTAECAAFLTATRGVPRRRSSDWRGHAYRLYGRGPRRRVVADGVLLVGDSAGLAYPQSGEGIRPAIESGLLAARTIIEARGRYLRAFLAPYEMELRARLDEGPLSRTMTRLLPDGLAARLAQPLLRVPGFVRHVVLDRWFLHENDAPLVWTRELFPAGSRISA